MRSITQSYTIAVDNIAFSHHVIPASQQQITQYATVSAVWRAEIPTRDLCALSSCAHKWIPLGTSMKKAFDAQIRS